MREEQHRFSRCCTACTACTRSLKALLHQLLIAATSSWLRRPRVGRVKVQPLRAADKNGPRSMAGSAKNSTEHGGSTKRSGEWESGAEAGEGKLQGAAADTDGAQHAGADADAGDDPATTVVEKVAAVLAQFPPPSLELIVAGLMYQGMCASCTAWVGRAYDRGVVGRMAIIVQLTYSCFYCNRVVACSRVVLARRCSAPRRLRCSMEILS